jgi:hypothetical protein
MKSTRTGERRTEERRGEERRGGRGIWTFALTGPTCLVDLTVKTRGDADGMTQSAKEFRLMVHSYKQTF